VPRFQNENEEIFSPLFSLEGAEESMSFVKMMGDMEELRSPLYTMFRKEASPGSNVLKIIKGNT
jgi:hypothetical protein